MPFLFPKLAIAITFLAAVSCEKAPRESEPLPAPGPRNDGVEMLSVGQGDQRLLRYRLTRGTRTDLELAMDLDLETGDRPGKMPTLILGATIEVADVKPSGDATLRTTITNVKMIDRAGATIEAAAVNPMLEQLTGVVHTATMAPDGEMRDAKVDTAKASPTTGAQLQQLTQTLEQIAMRLPSTPVGVGSSWTTRKQTQENGISLTTVTTMKVTSMLGDRIGFTNQTTLSAPDQKIKQQGLDIEVKNVGGGGTGSGTIDLSRVSMIGQIDSEFRATMIASGLTTPTRIKMQLRLSAPDR